MEEVKRSDTFGAKGPQEGGVWEGVWWWSVGRGQKFFYDFWHQNGEL